MMICPNGMKKAGAYRDMGEKLKAHYPQIHERDTNALFSLS